MEFRYITCCRICGSVRLKKYLDLGKQPLSNALLSREPSEVKKYPLQVLFCNNCYLSQLSIVVSPEVLYKDYPYHSSVSNTFKDHCSDMAIKAKGLISDLDSPLVLDIASNDGCLLEQFRNQGFEVKGVEPCAGLVNKSRAKDIDTICEFWNEDIKLFKKPDVITATNVFAHVDNVQEFLIAVHNNLSDSGVFIVELPYFHDMFDKNQFDTIYHEHLSYFLLKPLMRVFQESGLGIFRVEHYPIHGGSLRVYASKRIRDIEHSVSSLLDFELNKGMYEFNTYRKYSKKVNSLRDHFVSLMKDLRNKKKKVMGYAASAKGISLLNYCGIDKTHISQIFDDTPSKQGKMAPGCNIPIVSRDKFELSKPDYLVLLSWNFSKELMDNTKDFKRKGGKYIIPVPQVRIL